MSFSSAPPVINNDWSLNWFQIAVLDIGKDCLNYLALTAQTNSKNPLSFSFIFAAVMCFVCNNTDPNRIEEQCEIQECEPKQVS